MAHLALSFLGQYDVRLDGRPLTGFQSDKARALLAYLTVESGRSHRRERVASLFWPESSEATARASLRSALANLRRLANDAEAQTPCFIITPETIQFNLQGEVWLDVAEFNRMFPSEGNITAVLDPSSQLLEAARSALSLYRGNFLEGLTIKNCPEFDNWAYQISVSLQNRASHAFGQMAGYFERCGEIGQALGYARRRLELEPWQEEAHSQFIRLLAKSGDRSAALNQYEASRRILADELGVEPSPDTIRLVEAIREGKGLEAYPALAEPLPAPGEPPYKGLQFFDVLDSDLFFGRESLTARLGEHLEALVRSLEKGRGQPGDHFLAIVGASGSGKSSLLRAGLAALVSRNAFPGREKVNGKVQVPWTVEIITPTAHPMEKLKGLVDRLSGRRLLIVDQFEELFTLCRSEPQRQAFIDRLLHRDEPVVIALRADFYAHCGQYPELRKALSARQEYVGAMSFAELRQAIEEPARRNGWNLEQGLVDLILKDVGATEDRLAEPGALPLISYALLETWKRRRGRTLVLIGYQEAGGVHGVIANTAERVFSHLQPERQAITRRIFLRLTELGEGTQDTRRRASLDELVPAGESREATLEVIRELVNARLLVTEWSPEGGQEEIEMAHEALIHHWPRLQSWLKNDRDELRLGKRVQDAALEWQAEGRVDHLLIHRGERLATAWQAAQEGRLAFNQAELDYLNACQELSERERERRERQRNLIIFSTVCIAILMAGIAAWGLFQADSARRHADISLAQQLAAQADELLIAHSNNDLAMLLAIESLTRNPGRAANEILADSLSFYPQTVATLHQEDRISTVAFSPDGKRVVSGGWDRSARVWDVQSGQEVSRLDHGGPVSAVAFSPDGKWVASASQDGTARVWEASSGRELARMTHQGKVWAVAFRPDGRWVVSGSEDGTARVWEAATGHEVARMWHDGMVYSVAFSTDGTKVVSGSQDGTARVWDPAAGRELARIGASSELWEAAFSPDGTKVVTSGWNGVVAVWDAATGRKMTAMQHSDQVRAVAFSPDSTRIISGSDDGTARVWDVETGRELTRVRHNGRVLAVAFHPDGSQAVSAGEDGITRVWDSFTGRELTHLAHSGTVLATSFSRDGKLIACAGSDHTVHVWQTQTGRELAHMQHDGPVSSVQFSPDGERILSSSNDNTVRVWNAGTGEELAHMLYGAGALSAVFSKDGKLVISGNDDGSTRVWQAETGEGVTEMGAGQPVWSVDFSPDEKVVISGSQDGVIRIWHFQTGQELGRLEQNGPVTALAFTPDGKGIISGSQNGTAMSWDLSARKEFKRMQHDGPVTSVVVSPDGKLVITGSQDGTARIWDYQSGRELERMKLDGPVTSVAIDGEGKLVITGSQDGTARIWEVATGSEVARIIQDQAVFSVAFSPDSHRVVTGSANGAVRAWLWRNEDLIQLACQKLVRNLTQAEWKEYLDGLPYRQTCANLPPGH
ncbi:MAG TPA: BTAD domain-containing putative transcriptional regulator [Anaerolineaceae bacterium]|nr:BTAD domain-containing putative transcriptional regulator [Anaerolineaceae bacterium]